VKPLGLVPLVTAVALSLALGVHVARAQLEGADRGVPPIDSSSTFEVGGIEVDVVAESGARARFEGWRRAQLAGWKSLWARTNARPVSEAPNLASSSLDAMVSGIIVESEQIGPKRYIATLGVLFDRARTGRLIGVSSSSRRSVPMLVIPVMRSGSTWQSFESRTAWQQAWARFRTGSSPIDYVRTSGSNIDPLLLNFAQTRRPGRGWWRLLLDQYGAAGVITAEVHLRRLFPGGPAIGTFVARHGPDSRRLGQFTLRVENGAAIPRLLDEGIRRMDLIYSQALAAGALRPDPSLVIEAALPVEELLEQAEETPTLPIRLDAAPVQTGAARTFSIEVDTPDADAVNRAELAVSRVRGVTSALTTGREIGGTSRMRVTFTGDGAALRGALEAQGWSVRGSGDDLRMSR